MLTTLRIYSHLWAEAEEKTRSVLDEARAKARAARRRNLPSRAEGFRNPGGPRGH